MDGIEQKSVFDWKKPVLILFIIFGAISLVSGGIYLFRQPSFPQTSVEPLSASQTTNTPNQEATPSPVITPAPLNRADLKINILNAGGVKGAASKAALYLESLGYSDIKTGNADVSDQGQTILQISPDKQEYLVLLKNDLSSKYDLSDNTQDLTDTKFDIVILLGKN